MNMRTSPLIAVLLAAILALAFTACEGPAGADGLTGPKGEPGQDGTGFIPGTVTVSGSPMVVLGPVTAAYDNPENSPTITYRWYAGNDYSTSIGSSATYTPTVTDAGKTLTCRVYAVGFTGYKESAATVAVAAFAPPSPTALTSGSATDGTTSTASDVFWYSFTASPSNVYTIQVDDAMNSSPTKSGRVYVAAYHSNGTALFADASDTVDSPRTGIFGSGTIYIRVTPQSSSYLGTYTVKFDTASFPTPTALTGSLADGNLTTAGQADWYSFTPSSGSEVIAWEHNYTNGTTAYIAVSAYKSDGTVIFTNDSYTPSIAVGISGSTVYVRVSYGMSVGTYKIKYE